MNDITLKFPNGTFTHSTLAEFNGKTNQKIWSEYSRLRKEGIIVSAGTKSGGKGKPTLLWKLTDGQSVPVIEVVKEVKTPVAHVSATVAKAFGMNRLPKTLVNIIPDKKEVGSFADLAEAIMTVPTLPVTVAEPVVETRVKQTGQVIETEERCPFCQTKLLSLVTNGDVKVWCPVNDLKVCPCYENPYGQSNNVKNAVEVLHDKFFKHWNNGKRA